MYGGGLLERARRLGTSVRPNHPSSHFSHWLRYLPHLLQPSLRILKLLPRDREHLVAPLTGSKHNAQFVLGSAKVIAPLIAQTDDRGSHDIADPEAFRDFDLVNLCSTNVLLPDQCRERIATDMLAS